MRFYHVPGVSLAVINDGKIEWARGYGMLQSDRPGPVTPESRFQAASVSKPVASMGALALVEKGKLGLDVPVNDELRSWKLPENDLTRKTPVTLRLLLTRIFHNPASRPDFSAPEAAADRWVAVSWRQSLGFSTPGEEKRRFSHARPLFSASSGQAPPVSASLGAHRSGCWRCEALSIFPGQLTQLPLRLREDRLQWKSRSQAHIHPPRAHSDLRGDL
jgi:Beta-lactamase